MLALLPKSPTMAKPGSGHSGHTPATTDKRALAISGWLTGVYCSLYMGGHTLKDVVSKWITR